MAALAQGMVAADGAWIVEWLSDAALLLLPTPVITSLISLPSLVGFDEES